MSCILPRKLWRSHPKENDLQLEGLNICKHLQGSLEFRIQLILKVQREFSQLLRGENLSSHPSGVPFLEKPGASGLRLKPFMRKSL